MNNKQKISVILLLFSFFYHYSIAQNFKDVKLSNKLSILNGRVHLQFPANISTVDENKNDDYTTVINVNLQGVNIKFSAKDIFKTGSNKLFASLSKETSLFEMKKLISIKEDQQLQALLITTVSFLDEFIPSDTLINTLLVKTKDNAILKIDVCIKEKDFLLKNEVIKLSEEIFQTITSGTRLINLKARKEIRRVTGTQKNFIFKLPENYVLKDESNLFNVQFKIIKYNDFNMEYKDQFTFNISKDSYIDFEDFTYYEYEKLGIKLKEVKIKGEFLQEKIEWLTFDLLKYGLFLKEQIVQCRQLGWYHVVHISMLSPNQKNFNEMTKIIEAIELE